jgi:hypothetical protein
MNRRGQTKQWECCECGGRVERPRAPGHCPYCHAAGDVFAPAEGDAAPLQRVLPRALGAGARS